MPPTIMKMGRYRFFFNSREETRRHIHIATPEGTAKFWLEPLVALAGYHNLTEKDLKTIERLIKENEDAFHSAWTRHFAQ